MIRWFKQDSKYFFFMAKYRFKKKYADAQIAIPGVRKLITAETLTDKDAEMILKKYPRFAHNIELASAEPEGEQTPSDAPEVDKPKFRKKRKAKASAEPEVE